MRGCLHKQWRTPAAVALESPEVCACCCRLKIDQEEWVLLIEN